ncbi:ubiquitinyl hydrolase 1 puf isoform X2 [Tachypleus tridentatus]|uniref:ubiquitinyl hydrolase 1 puf isoform X2 n=1 Tax=Tachypleus tridentatus TaxID=6853 RepID=UPI003FD03712
MSVCDICSEVLDLLDKYEEQTEKDYRALEKHEVGLLCTYVQAWSQRQCTCCFKDPKSFDKFGAVLHGLIRTVLNILHKLPEELKTNTEVSESKCSQKDQDDDEKSKKEKSCEDEDSCLSADKVDKDEAKKTEATLKDDKPINIVDSPDDSSDPGQDSEDKEKKDSNENKETDVWWSLEEKEKLFHFVSKVFLLNFPLYVAFKHSIHSKIEEITQEQVAALSCYCDVGDLDIPIYLLKNVCFFCEKGGLNQLTNCFLIMGPDVLPMVLAHAMIGCTSNLKLWMNIGSIVKLLVPLRTCVIRYLCKVSDKDLRVAGNRNMFEFMWTAVKDPLDAPASFDKEGLDLAFKYFTSSTLTMRLAGIAQINSHINMYNDLCHNESLVDAESVGNALSNWLIDNKVIPHIFGPNLHVEIIKQSHIVLNFLAMEGRITNEEIDVIWSAAQLKHCSRQVLELLPPLIKNLEVSPVLHLYKLICNLEPREHNEQTLLLASALLKCIWSSSGSFQGSDSHIDTQHTNSPFAMLMKGALHLGELQKGFGRKRELSSSERSLSADGSNSEEDQPEMRCAPTTEADSSQVSDRQHSSADGSDHTADSQPSSPSGQEGFKQILLSKTKKKREHITRSAEKKMKEDTRSSSGDESELSSVSEETLRSDIDVVESSHLSNKCSERQEVNQSSVPKKKSTQRQKMLRRKRAKQLAAKRTLLAKGPWLRREEKDVCARLTIREIDNSPDGNDESDLNQEKPVAPPKTPEHNSSPISTLPEGQLPRPPGPQLLPELVKAVLEREGSLPRFNEGLDTETYDCRQYLSSLQPHHELGGTGSNLIEDILSPNDGSCNSSHASNRSEKNMADFEGEESACEDELAQLAAQAQAHLDSHPMRLMNMACMYTPQLLGPKIHGNQRGTPKDGDQAIQQFDVDSVCKPAQTILWDLLQDDKITQLAEGLAAEAERIFCNLLCWSTDKMIRMKVIEGCLDNLAHHKSVVISLRLLPKLLGSFQQFRSGTDTHSVTMWAEREHKMMHHFFNDLKAYTVAVKAGISPSNNLYPHTEEIQVRLHFLTCVFSAAGSPEHFRLNLEQVDILWSCLATDKDCADELFSWILNQAKNKDHTHALSLELFKHILLEKMPQLPPESTTMTSLNLLYQLSNVARLSTASYNSSVSEADVCGIEQLWGIALRALNTDVSMAAIQYLNNYYINVHHGTLEREEEFIQTCMDSLSKAIQSLCEAEEKSLMIIQRALVLLKTHVEVFHQRYAYHLRRWQLMGQGVVSHRSSLGERRASPLRIICQPAGMTEKTTLEMQFTDYLAKLRAEVTYWWEKMRTKNKTNQSKESEATTSTVTSSLILGSMLSDGPIRMISQGQELTTDLDEKTLAELGFKDLQLVYVSVGAARPIRRREGLEPASILPPPPQDRLPITLLLRPEYFEQLFNLMQQLGSLKTFNRAGDTVPHTKAQVLSRRVWDILLMLPTSPTMLEGFKTVGQAKEGEEGNGYTELLQSILNPESPQKLMYSLQIVEFLRRQGPIKDSDGSITSTEATSQESGDESGKKKVSWSDKFIEHGGLRHLFDIFMSRILLSKGESEYWNEWYQDSLASLLHLIYLFGISGSESDQKLEEGHDVLETPRKRSKRGRKGSSDKLLVPKLNQTMLQMTRDVETVLNKLMSILYEATLPSDPNQYKTGFWGRSQVVHCTMTLLVSLALSEPLLKMYLFQHPRLDSLLKRLVLDDPEPAVRQEACTALYRLCLGNTADGKTGHSYIPPLLNSLLSFLSAAQNMRPPRPDDEDNKEPYGPGCKDYFWLVCRLVDSVDEESLQECSQDQRSSVDLDSLIRYLAEAIISRDFRETRHNTIEDDGLGGLLTLATVVMKHNPSYKFSKEGQEFLLQVFDCLFALPSPKKRYLPKCKSHPVRSAAFDLLVELVKGNEENYRLLHSKLMSQHTPDSHSQYPWDYWPHEDGRSDCGYVGLTNLGATCYMASCMQHLYMMPLARASILSARVGNNSKHGNTLKELQRMFAYLMESERKAYNPRGFCKVYTMDHQPLNTGEQKDMAEFFTDLISKLEEMTPQLKELVRNLFCGELSNNVVSLDCPHISQTMEEFYTLRCQVADMRNLYESLDELTVKDTLEGDNMYTCSQCGKKVRAEKRACIKKLPHSLCFNTMRYTFNMVTMTKEKVNTHFSFPLRLDMSRYLEKNLMKNQHMDHQDNKDQEEEESYEYDLIGVTVHTGTADGGHYYSFILERQNPGKDKWFLFNDAEVKPFDPAHIAAECFGGEMTSKTYDSVTDKFMDFSFEKTNSAYMLFYERVNPKEVQQSLPGQTASGQPTVEVTSDQNQTFELSQELAEWIWQDNMQFLQDRSLFEHTYFNFMWQICGYIPQTLSGCKDITLLSAKLGTSFVLETFIHAKEKPTMAQWIELLTKQFNASQSACEWFLDHMAENDWWPVQILIKCPNQVVRQLFQRLCIHVINQLKPLHSPYFHQYGDSDDSTDVDFSQLGQDSCVTRFIKKLLTLIEHGAKEHLKHLTEYFAFLVEFAKMGEEECQFLLSVEAITTIVNFYLGQKSSDDTGCVEVVSDEDDDDDEVVSSVDDKYKPASLEKMITLVALLVERSRGDDHRLHLSHNDFSTVAGGKGFPFLHQQIRDNINLRQTCNLIFSLCRWNEPLAHHIINMIFSAITKQQEASGPFFKLLSMLVEFVGGPPGLPPFTNLILHRIWEASEYCPQQCLEWLTMQVPRNKVAHSWVLQNMDSWVERFLMAHNLQRVRNVAALLLVSLVPSNHFRQAFRSTRSMLTPQKEVTMSGEALGIMHQIYDILLRMLKRAKLYVDPAVHGTMKLMYYFAVLTYCLISRTEKLMFSPFFLDMWNLFQPKLSEPAIPVHHNKQALLIFWYQVCVDCPENVSLIIQNSHVTKNIAFNYILADHDDQEVVVFNRCMLPAYYGLLRLCCQQSRSFARQLASHQNIQWAFKNITPYTTQYTSAVNELFKLMKIFVTKNPDSTEQEIREIHHFKRTTLRLYLTVLDARACWATLINALRHLVETTDDRLFVICNSGLAMLFQAFHTLHIMYQEATACHVTEDMVELLAIALDLLKCVQGCQDTPEVSQWLLSWKQHTDVIHKLLTLLNSYTPPKVRHICIEVLQELILLYPNENLSSIIRLLGSCHTSFLESSSPITPGPYFPRRNQMMLPTKTSIRPQRLMFQMFLHPNQLECAKGVDEAYDQAVLEFFLPYHQFVDMLCRIAITHDAIDLDLVNLSSLLAIEGSSLHLAIFPKLWLDIYQLEQQLGKAFLKLLCNSNFFIDYLETVLVDERMCLNNLFVYQVFSLFMPKVANQLINEQTMSLTSSLISSVIDSLKSPSLAKQALKLNGDLRALLLLLSLEKPRDGLNKLKEAISNLKDQCQDLLKSTDHTTENVTITEDSTKETQEPPCKKVRISSEETSVTGAGDESTESEASTSIPKETPLGDNQAQVTNQTTHWAEVLLKSTSALLGILNEKT